MTIFLTNTLTKEKEQFTPLKKGLFSKRVSMYHCGPTVYNYPHIGNLRAYVFADTLKRLMLASGYKVSQVINITDVGHLVSDADTGEDKIEKAVKLEHKTAKEITAFYTKAFMDNIRSMNIDIKGTKFPRATEFIKEQIDLVKILEVKGFTYQTTDGVYFDTAKFPRYGELGKINLSGIREGERIGINDEKRNPTDFALWKFSPKNEKRAQEWPSPWGVGFPGWHIECSAMSMALLGKTFDIHTGGIDHIPVHHQNEIAQSECATGKPFVKYWVHSAFVNIGGGKMAKSEDNFITLDSIVKKGFSPLEYRYFLLGARYSTTLNFTWEALEAAHNAHKRLIEAVRSLPHGGSHEKGFWQKALTYAGDDLDTPKILALQWEILKNESLSPAQKRATVLKIDQLLGLIDLKKVTESALTLRADVAKLANDRKTAREAKDFKRSDEIRHEIESLGFNVKDTPLGQKITQS